MTQRVILPDGTEATIRPIEADDRDALREGFEGLSTESRHARFLAAIGMLSDDQLRYFTEVDGVTHVALVLTVPDADAPRGERGLGVARCVRHHPEDREAEFACTVREGAQGRGVGRLLMTALVDRARALGVERFRGIMLLANGRMQHLMADLGREIARESVGLGVVSVLYAIDGEPSRKAGPKVSSAGSVEGPTGG